MFLSSVLLSHIVSTTNKIPFISIEEILCKSWYDCSLRVCVEQYTVTPGSLEVLISSLHNSSNGAAGGWVTNCASLSPNNCFLPINETSYTPNTNLLLLLQVTSQETKATSCPLKEIVSAVLGTETSSGDSVQPVVTRSLSFSTPSPPPLWCITWMSWCS